MMLAPLLIFKAEAEMPIQRKYPHTNCWGFEPDLPRLSISKLASQRAGFQGKCGLTSASVETESKAQFSQITCCFCSHGRIYSGHSDRQVKQVRLELTLATPLAFATRALYLQRSLQQFAVARFPRTEHSVHSRV